MTEGSRKIFEREVEPEGATSCSGRVQDGGKKKSFT